MVVGLAALAVVLIAVGLVLAYFTGAFRGSVTVQSDAKQRRRHTLTGLVSAISLVVAAICVAVAVAIQLNTVTGLVLSLLAGVGAGVVLVIVLLLISSKIAENIEDKARTKSLSWRGGRTDRRRTTKPTITGPPGGQQHLPGPPGSHSDGLGQQLQPGFVYMTDTGAYVLALAPSASHPSPAVVQLPDFTVATPPTGPCVETGPIEIQVLTEEQGATR